MLLTAFYFPGIMVDHITRTVRQGFFSRLANSFVGILCGLLLVPGSVLLIGWNEYRTVHRSKGLAEAEGIVTGVVEPFEISQSQNDKLVHVIGTATTEEELSDAEFGISQTVLRLERKVEMYQWVERKEQKTRDKVGGGRETITTYSYEKKWHDGRVDSDRFEKRSNHENPSLRYSPKSLVTDRATLGVLRLPSSLVESRMNSWKNTPLDTVAVLFKFDDLAKQHFKVDRDTLYYSSVVPMVKEPQLGDLRISFRVVEPAIVSVLSKQQGEELVPYKTSNGETIQHLMMGNVTAAAMFESLKLENTTIAWLFRIGGWVMACVGFSLIVGPMKAVANIIPIFGSIVETVTFFVAVLLGSIVSLVTIAIAWISVRPLFAIGLIALAAGAIYLLSRQGKRTSGGLESSDPPVLTPL
jgi:hypothetical protein